MSTWCCKPACLSSSLKCSSSRLGISHQDREFRTGLDKQVPDHGLTETPTHGDIMNNSAPVNVGHAGSISTVRICPASVGPRVWARDWARDVARDRPESGYYWVGTIVERRVGERDMKRPAVCVTAVRASVFAGHAVPPGSPVSGSEGQGSESRSGRSGPDGFCVGVDRG
jgi:hypothetical protein